MEEHNHEHHHDHDHDHQHDHAYMHAHGIAHSHGHVHENQKAVVNRLSRAIGHLEKVKRMVEEGYDCSEVLVQLAAVRNAIENTGKVAELNALSGEQECTLTFSDGSKFTWEGYVSASINEGSVDAVLEMTISVTPSTVPVWTKGTT